MEDQLHKKKSK